MHVTHEQNLMLVEVKQGELFALWQEAKERGLAMPNIGLLIDSICYPGSDFCSLANAKSIPIAQAIAEKFDNIDFQHDIGNIGILGVDKDGAEWYQVSIGDAQGNNTSIGKIIGLWFLVHKMPIVIERLLDVYVQTAY